MPSFNNITVKAANGTTDVVYVALQRSSGDLTPTRYEVQAGEAIPARRAKFAIKSESLTVAKNASKRVIKYDGIVPYYDSTTGAYIGAVTLSKNGISVDQTLSTTQISEGVHRLCNLMASQACKDSAIEGASPA